MRTTLDLEDTLMRAAKRRAAEQGTTLTKVIEEALRRLFHPARLSTTRFKLKLLTKKGRPIRGVDLADRDALYERMEGRE